MVKHLFIYRNKESSAQLKKIASLRFGTDSRSSSFGIAGGSSEGQRADYAGVAGGAPLYTHNAGGTVQGVEAVDDSVPSGQAHLHGGREAEYRGTVQFPA